MKLLAELKRRLRSLVTRGLVTLVDSNQAIQLLQVQTVSLNDVEHLEPYGYTSHPHADAEALLLALGGRRAHTVAILAGDRRYRVTGLAQGEVALYDDLGQKVHLTRTGIVVVSDQEVTLDTPSVTITGDLTVVGSVSAAGQVSDGVGSMAGMRGTYNGHGHPALNTPPTQQM